MRTAIFGFATSMFLLVGVDGAWASKWEAAESTDRFTDETTYSVTLWDTAQDGWFTISCSSRSGRRTAFGWVAANYRLVGSDIPVEWRLGDRPRGIVQWHSIPGANLVWDGFSAHKLIEDLLEGEPDSTALIVRSRGNLLEFDIAGFSDAYGELIARCRL